MKTNISRVISDVAAKIGSFSVDQLVEDFGPIGEWNDDTFPPIKQAKSAIAEMCQELGVPYDGKSFEVWEKDGRINMSGPRIYGGDTVYVKWGEKSHKVDTDFDKVSLVKNEAKFKSKTATVTFPLFVNGEDEDSRKDNLESIEDCENWEELAGLLKPLKTWLSRAEIVERVSHCVVTELAERESARGSYLVVTGESNIGVILFSLPIESQVQVGDEMEVRGDTFSIGGVEYSSVSYAKVHELEVGKLYKVIKVTKDSSMGFESTNLALEGFGATVSANSQFKNWFSAVEPILGQVSPENPVNLTVVSVTERAGRKYAKLDLGIPGVGPKDMFSEREEPVESNGGQMSLFD